jgi:hypothetical protein
MVLKDNMKIIGGILAFVLMTLLFSCEELRLLTVNCEECYPDDLTMVDIKIKVDSRFGEAQVRIYEGNLEDNVLYDYLRLTGESTTVKVPVNKKYTLTATYYSYDGYYYVAVDAVTPHVKYDKNSCDEPCYYAYNNTVNLKLKYTK